jgi:hypothetical protein
MAPTEFHEALRTLGLAQQRVAALFGVGPRSVRRWQYGDRRVPCGVGIVFRLLAEGAVTVEQVERAVVPLSARMNGGAELPAPFIVESALEESALALVEATAPACANGDAEPEPPAPLDLESTSEACTDLAEAAPEQSTNFTEAALEQSAPLPFVPAPEPSAILAEPVTTAEKVAALTARACRWPFGDPQHSDFHFCGAAVVAPPYCEEHRAWPIWRLRRRAGCDGGAAASTRPPAGSRGRADADAAQNAWQRIIA